MATQVLNYHDAVIYDTDVGLFGEGGWLNDNCINWFFRCDGLVPTQFATYVLQRTQAEPTNELVDECLHERTT